MSDRFPVLVGEALHGAIGAPEFGRRIFPFRSWSAANRFTYPACAQDFLSECGSAAEAFFAREFTLRGDVQYLSSARAKSGRLDLELQARAGGYFVDAMVTDGFTRLAIEIDGMAFHHKTKEQVAADYLRERRIVLKGYTVVRFTAREAFTDPAECWRQVEAILSSRRQK